ncbi:MAG: FHA domain-containing protein [Sporichthyaceae bacterium]
MRITVESGPQQGRTFDLTGTFTIGREADCDLVLDQDPKVSRRHASIVPGPTGAMTLSDLGSGNGTVLNGTSLSGPVALFGGERVVIGSTTIAVIADLHGAGGAAGAPGLAATLLPPAGYQVSPAAYAGPEAAPPAYPAPAAPLGSPQAGPPGFGQPGPGFGPPGFGPGQPYPGPPLCRGIPIAAWIGGGVALALVLTLVLVLVLTSGGDDDSKRPGDPLDPSRPGGAGRAQSAGDDLERFCAAYFELAAAQPDPDDNPGPADYGQFIDGNEQAFGDFERFAPPEIRRDALAVSGAIEDYAQGDPTALADPAVSASGDRIDDFVDANC